MGMDAIAITDHGNMYGVYKFYKAIDAYNEAKQAEAEKAGIEAPKPLKGILGCEAYIVDDLTTRIHSEHIGHIVLLAKNNEGYINLCKMNTKAFIDGFYKKPRIDYNFLEKHSNGIICLSACLAGHIPYYLRLREYDEAKKYAVRLKKIFGEDFYIEIQDHNLPDQKDVNPRLVKLARELGIELVATNDVHYLNRDDADMQKALVCVTTKKTFDEPNDMLMPTDEFYLKSPEEMRAVFGDWAPEALENTVKIAAKCNCHPFPKHSKALLPVFTLPDEFKHMTKVEYFRHTIEAGLKHFYGDPIPQKVMERYETEFAVITKSDFVDYFLIVADIMNYANSIGVATGPGRGSGAGSIIAYAIGITRLDPLKYNLLFERFLHLERVSTPDFDLDFCCNRRSEVTDYVVRKYGADHVCQIVTFGTLAAKAAVKDIARVFKMPYNEVEKITKPIEIPQSVKPPLLQYVFDLKKIERPHDGADEKEIEKYHKEVEKSNSLRRADLVNLYRNSPEIKKIVDMAIKVEGFPRNCSTHAAGVIICKEIVGNIAPLQRNGAEITSQYDMLEVEELGMLKMDFLGLITLTDIQGTINDIKKYLGKTVDMYSFEYNDPEIYKMISSGDTDAVFQLESGGMKRVMKELEPDIFEDIISTVALFRPGPMDMIPDFCKNKHKPELTKYDHPMLEPILKNTYGQIVYQEQVMDIFRVMGGYSLGQADNVRRAMGKKDVKKMAKQKDIFLYGDKETGIRGAVANGVDLAVAKHIFEKMEKFAGYAFNKSHAACYAFISYQTAYLKHYYYPYYMANVLNNRTHKWDDLIKYIASVRKHNVDVLPPDINKSEVFFSVEKVKKDTNIRFGLAAIKNVGEALIESILKERTANGWFKDFGDFCNRVDGAALNKRCLESLIFAGAFDELGDTRNSLMHAYPNIVKLVSSDKKASDVGQVSMFDVINKQISVKIPKLPEYDEDLKLKNEKDVVGIYLSGHPLSAYTELFDQFSFNTSKVKSPEDEDGEPVETADDDTAEAEFGNDSRVTFGAIITTIKKVVTKAAKQEMCVLRVEDLYGSIEVMLFPKVYANYKNVLEKDSVVKIVGRISLREGESAIILADSVTVLKERTAEPEPILTASTTTPSAGRRLYLKYNTKDAEKHKDVCDILKGYGGKLPVIVRCSSTMEVLQSPISVRECQAIKFELEGLVGAENVMFK
jgi:DNA polymerase-3 subunit alpha